MRSSLVLSSAAALLVASCALIAGVEEGRLRPGSESGGGSGGIGGNRGAVGGGGSAAGGSAAGGSANGGQGGSGGGGSTGVGGMIPGMINVPSVTFMMGCNNGVDSDCRGDESPYHEVTLSDYRIDVFEVTRSDFNLCIDDSDCNTPTCDWDATGLPDHPVTCVSWQDAVDYCTWAGKRLPTEAEWEHAARGTSGDRYPWGNNNFDMSPSPCTLANANLCRLDTETVGKYPTGASPIGAMDMAGNVIEWVNDLFLQDYYNSSPATDPQGPSNGSAVRTLRGGGWNSGNVNFRTSARSANLPTFFDNETGFRCAL